MKPRLASFERAMSVIQSRRPLIRRCAWCQREIVGVNEPGRMLPADIERHRVRVTDGMCDACLRKLEIEIGSTIAPH